MPKYMGLTQKDRVAGGKAVHLKYGSDYMKRIGKKGRRKQLKTPKSPQQMK